MTLKYSGPVLNISQKSEASSPPEQIIGCQLLSNEKLQSTIAGKKKRNILPDLAHPGDHLSETDSSGRRCRSINTTINSTAPPESPRDPHTERPPQPHTSSSNRGDCITAATYSLLLKCFLRHSYHQQLLEAT